MPAVLETLLNTLLVLGTSVWGWLGLAAGFFAAYVVWSVLHPSVSSGAAAAVAFAAVFAVFAWQELRSK
jgi:hypothetical protein